jgi:hypothetical protein
MDLRIACEEGLGGVPHVGYKRTAKTKDEALKNGGVAKKGEIKTRRRESPTTEMRRGRAGEL